MVMKIKRVLVSLLFLIGSGGLASASGAGYTFSLDLREGARGTLGKETIQWNSDWDDEGTANTVSVTVGDEILLEDGTGSGAVTWLETESGLYTMTHTTTSPGGEVLDTMTAQFVVDSEWRGEMDIVVSGCTNVYDGLGHSITAEPQGVTDYTVLYALSADGPFTSESPVFTNLVTTSIWYHVWSEGYSMSVGEVTFVITEATFADGSIVATDYLGAYDGNPHTITVTAPSTATVTYALSEEGPFTSTNPSFTDVVSTSVWYRVEQYGYTTVTGSASLHIAIASFGDGYVEATGYSGIFDAQYHTITVTAPSSVTITYALSEDGPFTSTLPTFRDAISTSVWYRAEKTGYTTVTSNETVVIGLDEGRPFDLDLRSDPRESSGVENIQWSGLWDGDGTSAVTVSVSDGEVLVDGETGESTVVWLEMTPGTYTLTHVTSSDSEGDPVELTAQFHIPDDLSEMDVTVLGYTNAYDGAGHSITVTPPDGSGASILYALSPDGPYSSDNPVFTNVVSTSVWYHVSAAGYKPVSGSAAVVITAAAFANGDITVTGYEGAYDGTGHSITVTAPTFATVTYSLSEDGEFTTTNPSFTEIGSATVWCRVEAENYMTVSGSASVVITTATFADGSISATGYDGGYDGDEHTISVTAPEGATVTYSLSEGGPYTTDLPTFTNAVSATVWYCVSQEGYVSVTNSASVVIGGDEGVNFALDLREDPRETHGEETIQWSGLWAGDESSTVTVSVNGTALVTDATGEGAYDWSETAPGTYYFTNETYQGGAVIATLTASFILPGTFNFFDWEISAEGYEGDYDGAAHTITVTAPEGATVTYALTEDGEFTDENPSFMDVVSTNVWYCISAEGYNSVTGSVPMVIHALDVAFSDSLTAQQRYPWNGIVDIDCALDFAEVLGTVAITVSATDLTTGESLTVQTLTVDGSAVENGSVAVGPGSTRVTWNAEADVTSGSTSTNLEISVVAANPNATSASDTVDGVTLDLRTAPRETRGEETIQWSTLWDGDETSTVKVSVDGVVLANSWTDEGSAVWQESNPGTYTFTHVTTLSDGTTKTLTTAFVLPEALTFYDSEISATGYDGDYDGAEHSITVTAPEGATVTYSLSEDGAYSDELPTFTEAMTTTVWYRVEMDGYVTVTNSATVVIGGSEGLGFELDLREDPRETHGAETIQWSGLWAGDEESVVLVRCGSTAYVSQESGEGSFEWTTTTPGTNKFYHVTYQNNKVVETLTASFILPEVFDFADGDISAEGYEGDYDGAEHSISVTAPDYATVTYALTADGAYTAENPSFTDVVSTSVWYCVSADGYNSVTGSVGMVILPLEVTFTDSTTQAQQRYPWNGCVDIDCAFEFAETLGTVSLTVSATDLTTGDELTVETLTMDGTEVENGAVAVAPGSVRVTWDAAADVTEGFTSTNLAITVVAENPNATGASNTVAGVSLDLREEPRPIADGAETLYYDALWYGDGSDSVTMTITVEDETLAEGLTGSGTVSWDSLVVGTNTLTLVTYVNGVSNDAQTAIFYGSGKTSQGVPYTWLEEQWLILSGDNTREDYEDAAVGDMDEDGYLEWEEYVVGTDPWDAASYGFSIVSITMDENGLPVIVWEPDLNEGGTLSERVYTVLEADSPAGPWTEGSGTDSADGRTMETGSAPKKFYKVTVGLPQ